MCRLRVGLTNKPSVVTILHGNQHKPILVITIIRSDWWECFCIRLPHTKQLISLYVQKFSLSHASVQLKRWHWREHGNHSAALRFSRVQRGVVDVWGNKSRPSGIGAVTSIVFICVRSLLLGNLGKRFIFSPLKPYEWFLQWGSIKKINKKYQHPEPILLSAAPYKAERVYSGLLKANVQ